MSDDPHPLWATIERDCESISGPLIEFRPKDKFLPFLESSSADPLIKAQVARVYQQALNISILLERGAYCDKRHELAYRFVGLTSRGAALGNAAWKAFKPGIKKSLKAAFVKSLELPGIETAADAYAKQLVERKDDPRSLLKWVNRELAERDPEGAKFMLRILPDMFDDPADYLEEIANEVRRSKDAKRKTAQRGGPRRKDPKYREWIRQYWLPAALWCRGTPGIILLLNPKTKNIHVDIQRIESDISFLGYSSSRRRENEKQIEEAEELFSNPQSTGIQ